MYWELGSRDFLRGRRVTVDGLTGTALGMDRPAGSCSTWAASNGW